MDPEFLILKPTDGWLPAEHESRLLGTAVKNFFDPLENSPANPMKYYDKKIHRIIESQYTDFVLEKNDVQASSGQLEINGLANCFCRQSDEKLFNLKSKIVYIKRLAGVDDFWKKLTTEDPDFIPKVTEWLKQKHILGLNSKDEVYLVVGFLACQDVDVAASAEEVKKRRRNLEVPLGTIMEATATNQGITLSANNSGNTRVEESGQLMKRTFFAAKGSKKQIFAVQLKRITLKQNKLTLVDEPPIAKADRRLRVYKPEDLLLEDMSRQDLLGITQKSNEIIAGEQSPSGDETSASIPESWTAYPSLLSSLTTSQQILLEKAASAHYCGRYQEADAIFASELPPSHTIPIVALQHADMLTSSGRERKRIEVIRAAQSSLDLDAEHSSLSLKLLLDLMLAEAEFFANGILPNVNELLSKARVVFLDGVVNGLSDLQIQSIATYHQFVDTLRESTNKVQEEDEHIFEDENAGTRFSSRLDELVVIYHALKNERRWRHAPLVMSMMLKYSKPGQKRQDAIKEAAKLREVLSNSEHPGIKFRSIPLRNSLATVLPPQMGRVLREENIKILTQLKTSGFKTWKEFCPVVATMLARSEATEIAAKPENLKDSLLDLATDAESRNDLFTADQLYRAAKDIHYQWLNSLSEADTDQRIVLDSFRRLQEAYIEFHQTRSGSDFFYASGVADLLSTLFLRYRDYTAIVTLVDHFVTSRPDFANPLILERIYDIGINAASALGLNNKFDNYMEQYKQWGDDCPIMDPSGNFADKTILDPVHAVRWIGENGPRNQDAAKAGENAVRIMLRWAAYEWDEALLSTEDIRDLFDTALLGMPQEKVSTYLRNINVEDVVARLLGTIDDPVDSTSFLKSYQKLLHWAKAPDRRPSSGARLFAMKVFIRSRIHRFGNHLQRMSQNEVTQEKIAAYENERKKELEVEKLQADANNEFVDSTKAKREAIHTLLVKSFQGSSNVRQDICESDFEARIEDAQQLVQTFEKRGDLLRQYDAIVCLIRLLWQRHLLYGQTGPEIVLEPAEQAEEVFCKVRDLILSKDASENLIARAKVPSNFPYNEHYRFALVGSFMAYKNNQKSSNGDFENELQSKTKYFMECFLSWSLRSKGRGFSDILNMESGIAKSIDMSKVTYPTGESPAVESNTSTSKTGSFRVTTVTKAELDAMLNELGDGVVIVDYIDLPYSPEEAKRVAILYRRGQDPVFAPVMPVTVPGQVYGWVSRNLTETEANKPLDQLNSDSELSALSVLIDFVGQEKYSIKEGETLLLCPTGILNRLPFHAIPIGGRPLIDRNPILYCQSLTILHWLWKKSAKRGFYPTEISHKATVVNPMPENWPGKTDLEIGDPVLSTPEIQRLASQLGASYIGGYPVDRTTALSAISGAQIFHYHGHVYHDTNSALDSFLSLGATSLTSPSSKSSRIECISARDFFTVKLADSALATIIGCSSGRTTVSSTDDVLGLPTALFYAGAKAVVSTLWDIEDPDGEAFAIEFYAALQKRNPMASGERHGFKNLTADGGVYVEQPVRIMDLAASMREAILELRRRPNPDLQTPYHWAAFTLSGLDLMPIHPDCEITFTWPIGQVFIDLCKGVIERIVGCQLSWWPLCEPEDELMDGYTRIYSMAFRGRRFYEDIPSSLADEIIPQLRNARIAAPEVTSGARSRESVFLRNTTLMHLMRRYWDSNVNTVAAGNAQHAGPEASTQKAVNANVPSGIKQQEQSTPIKDTSAGSSGLDGSQDTPLTAKVGAIGSNKPISPGVLLLSADIGFNESRARIVELGNNDQTTFQNIRRAYRSMTTSWHWWKRPTRIRFYRFHSFLFKERYNHHYVHIHRDKERYPEEQDQEYAQYLYRPQPWPSSLPYPSHEAWYYFCHPKDCGTSTELNSMLPVRLRNNVPSGIPLFGIHVEDRYSALAIFFVASVMCLLTLAATIWFIPYWLNEHPGDLQNATTPAMAAFAVVNTFITLSVTLLVFRLTNL